MRNLIEHEAIAASAGSGKTFQLAHRYIRLLANGVPADRIIALTFSRKAAGEIFDAIVEHLGNAAGSAKAARETAKRIEMSGLRPADFLRMLRRFLDLLHRLHVGTLDSFIVGILRAFPAELGIPADFRILDDESPSAAEFRREVLAAIFNPGQFDSKPQRDFLRAFKQATFGREEKTLGDRLDSFIDENRATYRRLPDGAAWGSERAIWPQGSEWLTPPDDVSRVVDRWRALLAEEKVEEGRLRRWESFLAAAGRFRPGSPWTKDIGDLFKKLAGVLEGLRAGRAEIVVDRKKTRLDPRQCRLALDVIRHVMRSELQAALQRTRGIFGILDQYERLYDAALRRAGRLTFSDAQYLLTGENACSGGAQLSRVSGAERRLYVDYRLDCRLDHWLLDEFQDTSDLQWAALGNLAEEILQDGSGERSFFYVGDVKQAIYGWRGGNRRLFGAILEKYREVIRPKPLSTSYRSDLAVIDTVNAVFGRLAEAGLPESVLADWARLWQAHACRADKAPGHGYAALLEPPRDAGGEKPDAEDRYRIAACLLKEMDPLRRGLSVAILVRTNAAGRAVVDVLRRECPGMTIVHEGHAPIADNPVVSVLLALARFAAHPGDTFALRHLQMSPLGRWFGACERASEGASRPASRSGADFSHKGRGESHPLQTAEEKSVASATEDALPVAAGDCDLVGMPLSLLREIQADGFQAFLRRWGDRLEERAALDDSGRMRLQDMLRAAAEFDATGSRDCDSFVRSIKGYEVSEGGSVRSVRVMTIHQSKGLGFDAVILPDLMGRSMTGGGQPGILLAHDSANGAPRWALDMPRRTIADQDAVLSARMKALDEESCLDALCVLYVALTRARHALYMVTSYPGPKSTALTEAALIKTLLTGGGPEEGKAARVSGAPCARLYERGERGWYKEHEASRETPGASARLLIPSAFAGKPSRRKRLVRVEPSAEEETVTRAAWLFDAESGDVLDFGTGIHALFAEVGWIDESDPETIVSRWLATGPSGREEVKRDVCAQFRRAFALPELREALARPADPAELWREKRFEIVLDGGQWVSGAFDRVVIFRGARGKPSRATILDYKSDRVDDPAQVVGCAEKYRPQLVLYAQALSRILGLDLSLITLQLLFTRPGKVVEAGRRGRGSRARVGDCLE